MYAVMAQDGTLISVTHILVDSRNSLESASVPSDLGDLVSHMLFMNLDKYVFSTQFSLCHDRTYCAIHGPFGLSWVRGRVSKIFETPFFRSEDGAIQFECASLRARA